jgi:hypothetical protein
VLLSLCSSFISLADGVKLICILYLVCFVEVKGVWGLTGGFAGIF